MSNMPKIPRQVDASDLMRLNDDLRTIGAAINTQNDLLRQLLDEVKQLRAAQIVRDDKTKAD